MAVDLSCSESKIDRLESRLANIESLLRQATGTSSPSTHPTPASSHASNRPSNHAANHSPLGEDYNGRTPVTGDIGLRVESMAAKNALEQTIGRDLAVQQDPLLMSALESLRGIVNCAQLDASDPPIALNTTSLAKSASEAPLPDWEQVRTLLDRAESLSSPPSDLVLHICSLLDRIQAHDVQSFVPCSIRRLLPQMSVHVRRRSGRLAEGQAAGLRRHVQHLFRVQWDGRRRCSGLQP